VDNTISKFFKNGKIVSLYDNLPFIFECFMTYNMPSRAKKHHENTKPESHQTAKMFLFLLLLLLLLQMGYFKIA